MELVYGWFFVFIAFLLITTVYYQMKSLFCSLGDKYTSLHYHRRIIEIFCDALLKQQLEGGQEGKEIGTAESIR